MKSFLKRWFFTTVAVLVATQIVPGIHYDTRAGLITATLLLGILNAVARPVMIVLSLPLVVLSLGLFIFVINALLLWWVGQMKTFHVDTFFWDAIWGALIISAVTMALNILTGTGGSRIQFHRKKPPSPPPPGDDGGPVIDV
jgi:putative membrane protein